MRLQVFSVLTPFRLRLLGLFTCVMLVVFIYGLARPFYNEHLQDNHNSNRWTSNYGLSYGLLLTAIVIYTISFPLFARRSIRDGYQGFRRFSSQVLTASRPGSRAATNDDEPLLKPEPALRAAPGAASPSAGASAPQFESFPSANTSVSPPGTAQCLSCGHVNAKESGKFCAKCGQPMAVN